MARVLGGLVAIALLALTGRAEASIVAADQVGWIDQSGDTNGNAAGNNYLVGNCGANDCAEGEYRDFFGFTLGADAAAATSATFTIFTGFVNTTQSSPVILQLTATAAPLSFNGLGTGTVYATSSFTNSSASSYATITLDAAALADIQAFAGREFYLSGRVTNATFGANVADQYVFGGTGNNANTTGPTLTLTSGTTAVPEPASFLLLGAGVAGLALSRRRVGRAR